MARVDTKTIRVEGPDAMDDVAAEDREEFEKQIEEIVQNFDWSAIESLVSDSLPNGYFCKIDD